MGQALPVERQIGRYPGRGLLVHVSGDGHLGWIYFVTGRSPASRRRRARRDENRVVIESTEAATPRDSLRHYTCVRVADERIVVGNGDHVDVIADLLAAGATVDSTLERIDPEPDPPIHTPRIALCLGATAELLIAHKATKGTSRLVVNVPRVPCTSTVVTTYDGDIEVPAGTAPVRTTVDRRDFDDVAHGVWASLDHELRVLLVAGAGTDVPSVVTLP